jgi:probable HAF family extracellular repeat protein
MKAEWIIAMTAAMSLATFAAPIRTTGQNTAGQHRHYKLIVLGPLGGPTSGIGGESSFGTLGDGTLNNAGATLVAGDTPAPDPFNPGSNIFHPYLWWNGVQIDFRVLPVQPGSAGNDAYANWVNEEGLSVGWSATGVLDPITGAPEAHAVIWTPDGKVFDLGTLGGYQSQANAVNDFGQITGWVENTTPDPFSFGEGAETQAFIWQFGVMRPLGTLGGPDSIAFYINNLGQAAGCSYTNSTPNAATGSPTIDAFIWKNGKMIDLNPGNFGGTFACANFLNNRGQVVGEMTDADENNRPFLWDNGKITDLFTIGNLGGLNGSAKAVNMVGHVAGDAFNSLHFRHAALWRGGGIVDLQTVNGGPCSDAYFLNSSDEIVGTSGACDESTGHAFLWENGSIVDLNALIPTSAGIELQFAYWINDRGEIAGNGILTENGDNRAFLLIPCDANHPRIEGCDYSLAEASTTTSVLAADAIHGPAKAETETKISAAEIIARYHPWLWNGRRRIGGSPQK